MNFHTYQIYNEYVYHNFRKKKTL